MPELPEVVEQATHWGEIVDEKEALKTKIKRLNAKATQAKMDLHDLSEDLPIGWENILELANLTYTAYHDLTAAKAQLAAFEGG
ncbi:MAG: CCE_0567 family metalloprotein [Acidithiobacillus sp.]